MSYQMRNDPRARKAGRFIHRVQKELQNAFVDSGLKQQEIAERLGVNRSVVNKRLQGEANLTLRTIADLAWAMDAEIDFTLKSRRGVEELNNQAPVDAAPTATASGADRPLKPESREGAEVRYENGEA
ncbi:MAG: helix-turn-helix transcriptional regulator [Microvirga sp.]|nr:helix-turn-helix transcriptional regulator [Microvirga sp.]